MKYIFLKELDKIFLKIISFKYPIKIKKTRANDTLKFFYTKENWNNSIKEYWVNIENSEEKERVWINNFFKDFDKASVIYGLNKKEFFKPYKTVLDLGAGPLYTTYLLKILNPDKRCIAADYGDQIIEYVKSIKILKDISYFNVDVMRDELLRQI